MPQRNYGNTFLLLLLTILTITLLLYSTIFMWGSSGSLNSFKIFHKKRGEPTALPPSLLELTSLVIKTQNLLCRGSSPCILDKL